MWNMDSQIQKNTLQQTMAELMTADQARSILHQSQVALLDTFIKEMNSKIANCANNNVSEFVTYFDGKYLRIQDMIHKKLTEAGFEIVKLKCDSGREEGDFLNIQIRFWEQTAQC